MNIYKNDDFCTKTDESCIQNQELCIQNEECCINDDGFRRRSGTSSWRSFAARTWRHLAGLVRFYPKSDAFGTNKR